MLKKSRSIIRCLAGVTPIRLAAFSWSTLNGEPFGTQIFLLYVIPRLDDAQLAGLQLLYRESAELPAVEHDGQGAPVRLVELQAAQALAVLGVVGGVVQPRGGVTLLHLSSVKVLKDAITFSQNACIFQVFVVTLRCDSEGHTDITDNTD